MIKVQQQLKQKQKKFLDRLESEMKSFSVLNETKKEGSLKWIAFFWVIIRLNTVNSFIRGFDSFGMYFKFGHLKKRYLILDFYDKTCSIWSLWFWKHVPFLWSISLLFFFIIQYLPTAALIQELKYFFREFNFVAYKTNMLI